MSAPHAVAILAAGGSRRLGRPKQLLTRDGETLVHRCARLAMQTQPAHLVLVTGAHAQAVHDAVRDLVPHAHFNPSWGDGLASSLQCAGDALRGHDGAVLILVCDQPALDAAHLRALLQGAAQAPSGCAATVHGDALGVPAVVSAAVLRGVSSLQGDRGLGTRLTAMDAVWQLDAPVLALDIDREADVEEAIRRGWLDP